MLLKCRTKVDAANMIDDDELIKQFLRKNFLKFYINIYKHPACKGKDEQFMVDINLFKGTTNVFLDFLGWFIKEIET